MTKQTYFSKRGRRRGVALVIILAFLVLLVGVAIAFLSRALTERQVSNSSAGETKADILARSGLDVVMGDLKQEIVNGSVTPAPNPAPGVTLYYPKLPVNAVPVRDAAVAALSGTLQIPSLIRVSGTVAPALPAVETALASANAVSTGVSANGRSVSLSRWNAHYLIPRANTTGTDIDCTPVSSFGNVAPNWVMVTNSGPAVLTTPTNAVIGRYAYAIYDEGGLLDMNVAGYPSSVSGTQSGLKGSEALADLSQIGLSSTGSGINNQIDTLLGWRNYATLQPTAGSLSAGYNFQGNIVSGSNYLQFVTSNTNGFLTVSSQPYPSPLAATSRTDQIFTSRQDLLKFARGLGWNQNALQYMATFTRDIEQPFYVPNPARPKIQSSVMTPNKAPFGTGNDAYNLDRTGTPSTDINPPFLEVRVATAFTRPDGTPANVGDPLVKKRFPLSRLGLMVTGATANQNQTDPIYQNFGLYRANGIGPWLYNHGNPTGIYRLDQVKSLGREPDFFELLKAAINVGSIGKAALYSSNTRAYTSPGTAGYLQAFRDNQTALQILQIGANIIDQCKEDNFPTRIQFAGDSNVPPYEVRGVEDLPYFYRIHNWIMRLSSTGAASGVIMFQPELWNPHSPGSSAGLSGTAMPTQFRVRVQTDPSSTTSPLTSIFATYSSTNSIDESPSSPFNSGTSPQPLLFNAGDSNGYYGFREPTLLAQIGVPGSCHLTGSAFTDYPAYTPNPSRQMTGLFVASFPWCNGTNAADFVQKINISQNGDASCLRFYLDYMDSSGRWVTYDDEPYQPFDNYSIVPKPQSTAAQIVQLQTFGAAGSAIDFYGGGRTDPRTSRWGFYISEYLYAIPALSSSNSDYGTFRPDAGLSFGSHWGSRADAGIVGGGNSYPKVYRGFQHGYWTENSIRATYQTDGSATLRYIRDPDGVCRRAMAGYWSDTANNGNPSPSVTSGTTPMPSVIGLPMATGTMTTPNYESRPTILHRPFRSVAELGYVFSDTPWRNVDLSFPESGDSPLLDVFCLNEDSDTNALVAGRVNLNTRQAPVLQAVLSGALLDKDDPTNPILSATQVSLLAAQLVARTSGSVPLTSGTGPMPLTNRADIVGSWSPSSAITSASAAATALAITSPPPDPNAFYSGFSADIGALAGVNGTPVALIPRQREAVMRALTDSGTSRVWNLMIDLLAQSGRYKPNAQSVGSDFVVEGERRYWLHVAIDRYTGQILDKQLELVNE